MCSGLMLMMISAFEGVSLRKASIKDLFEALTGTSVWLEHVDDTASLFLVAKSGAVTCFRIMSGPQQLDVGC